MFDDAKLPTANEQTNKKRNLLGEGDVSTCCVISDCPDEQWI